MLKKMFALCLIAMTIITLQTSATARGRHPHRPHGNYHAAAGKNDLYLSLISTAVYVSAYAISYSLESGARMVALDDFLQNEKNVVLKEVKNMGDKDVWVFERESDKGSFTIETTQTRAFAAVQPYINQTLEVDVSEHGTIFASENDLVLFVLNEQGRRELTNL